MSATDWAIAAAQKWWDAERGASTGESLFTLACLLKRVRDDERERAASICESNAGNAGADGIALAAAIRGEGR